MSKLRYHKFFIILFALAFLFILFPKKVFAFQEEFNGSNLNDHVWQSYTNKGTITLESGSVHISSNAGTCPYVTAKNNLFPTEGNFNIQLGIQYTDPATRGTGFVLGNLLPPNGTSDQYFNEHYSDLFFLKIWQDSVYERTLNISFTDCPIDKNCTPHVIIFKSNQNNEIDTNFYHIKIEYLNNVYKIYVSNDSHFTIDDLVYTSSQTLKKPTTLWFGDPLDHHNYAQWSSFQIDYIYITSEEVIPTSTPTPTPTSLQPLVLLPGLGSSWNHENMILDIEKPQSEWYMMPGIKIYDGLIETLKNAGYETEGENKNLFVFNYNWTKPVNSITEDFKTYIENVVNPLPEEKIDLLGHSLGGLVARNYIQNNQENSVDQLITLGSPLKGVPSVYYLWEGGNLSKFLPTWQRIGIGLLFHLRKPNFSTNMEALRTVTPVFNDLLPTFNYLKQNGNEKELSQMSEKNDWLINLNNSPPSYLLSVTNNFLGTFSNSTTRWINVTDPNWLDRLLGFWSDGKPSGEELDEGDRVVLSESASLNGATVTYIENINHQELVTSSTSQQKIMEAFNLSPSSISTISTDLNYNSSLVFQIASPATIAITDPNGNLVGDGDDKLIIITDPLSGEYQINLAGTANGPYDLHIGQILNDKDFWTTTSGSINEGDEISYKIAFNPSAPLENPIIDQTGEIYIETAQNQISNLREEIKQQSLHPFMKRLILIQLNRTESLLNKDKFEKAIISLYKFRLTISFWQRTARLGKDRGLYFKNKTQEIINNLEDVYVIYETNKERIYNQRRLKREILLAQKIFDKIENKLQKLSKKGVINPDYGALYLLSQTKLNKAKNSSSYEAHINILSAKLLSREGFFLFK